MLARKVSSASQASSTRRSRSGNDAPEAAPKSTRGYALLLSAIADSSPRATAPRSAFDVGTGTTSAPGAPRPRYHPACPVQDAPDLSLLAVTGSPVRFY